MARGRTTIISLSNEILTILCLGSPREKEPSGMIAKLFTLTAALALPLALSACGRDSDSDQNLSSLDASLTNAEDPALRSALGDQIIVDPELADQSNAHRVRPADRPVDGALPAIAGKEYNAAIGGKLLRTPKAVEATPCKSCEEGKAVTLGALASSRKSAAVGKAAATPICNMEWPGQTACPLNSPSIQRQS